MRIVIGLPRPLRSLAMTGGLIILLFSQIAHADDAFVNRPDVKLFIHQMAQKHHFNEAQLTTLFKSVKIRQQVMRKVHAPLEQRPWHIYQKLFITEWRIRKGVEFWNKYQQVLQQVEKKYGVPANIIVATIGIETKYGSSTGGFPVIDALTNIAFSHNSRAPFFRNELEEFLLLAREQHLDPLKVMGSYAGAIGQPQFMPSSYRRYAVSYTGHATIDLSNNEMDIIASIANYYKLHGWEMGQPIATPVSVATLAKYKLSPHTVAKNQKYDLIQLQDYWGYEYWLGFHNFEVIKRYNASDLYAMAVFQLSHYISTLRNKLNED